jgi:hypothetical protein
MATKPNALKILANNRVRYEVEPGTDIVIRKDTGRTKLTDLINKRNQTYDEWALQWGVDDLNASVVSAQCNAANIQYDYVAPPPPPFVPPVPGMFAWYDAAVGVTTDSGVKYWTDRVGVSLHAFTQSVGSKQPYLSASSPDYNGYPVIHFDGSDDELRTPLWAAGITVPQTIYAVCEVNTYPGGFGFLYDGYDTVNRCGAGIISLTQMWLFTTGLGTPTTVNITVPVVLCVQFNGTSTRIYRNTSGSYFGGGTLGTSTLTGMTLAAYPGGGYNTNTVIAELLIYTGSHSDSDISSTMLALGAKYGITIT